MAIKSNSSAISFLNNLINSNKINDGAWAFSAGDGNKLLGSDEDWDAYSKVHLAIDDEFDNNTKNYYKYPVAKYVGDEIQLFRQGLITAKRYASGARGAQEIPEIVNSADKLLKKLENNSNDTIDNETCNEIDTNIIVDNKKESIFHIDIMNDTVNNLSTKFCSDNDGNLTGNAIVTNIGVFTYKDKNGNTIREARLPEHVFDNNSIKSLSFVPITDEHPQELVNKHNMKKYMVGITGNDVKFDGYAISIPMKIFDKKPIDGGKKSLSCGYMTDLVYKKGNFLGMDYDCIQTNIRYNHVAIVDKGRAGDLAKIRFDSYYQIEETIDNKNNNNFEDTKFTKEVSLMKKIIIDNREFEGDERLLDEYDKISKQKKDTENELKKMTADRDTLKDEIDKFKKEKTTEVKLDDLLNKRLKIIEIAKKLNVDYLDNNKNYIPELELKKNIIKSKYQNAKLDDKDEIYINARYDVLVELLDDLIKKENDNKLFNKTNEKPKEEVKTDSKRESHYLNAFNNYKTN